MTTTGHAVTTTDSRPSIDAADKHGVAFWLILPFLVITFGIAWGILGLYVAWPDQMAERFGALSGNHPLFFLAVYAPAIGGLVVVGWAAGLQGILRFLSRLLLWRCNRAWYGFILVGIPVVFFAGSAIKGNLGQYHVDWGQWPALLVALGLMAIKGPIEEIGWRGVGLPLLQRYLAPLWAGLGLGIIWGLWHLPAFLLSGTPQSEWSFTAFFVGSVTLSVICTPLFNQSRGSILLPMLYHYQLINPLWPDAQPYDTMVLIGVAVVIVWLNRRSMFTRRGAVVRVVPTAESARPTPSRHMDGTAG